MRRYSYYLGNYDAAHWALSPDPAFVVYSGKGTHVKLNPTDCRGYRCIVSLGEVHPKTGKVARSTLNRPYTLEEEANVFKMAIRVKDVFTSLGIPDVHIILARNNAHFYNSETGQITLGSEDEPFSLHVHLISRGVPDAQYLNGVPLRGPQLGEMFNLRGDGKKAEGQRKIKWSDQDRLVVKDALEGALRGQDRERQKHKAYAVFAACALLFVSFVIGRKFRKV